MREVAVGEVGVREVAVREVAVREAAVREEAVREMAWLGASRRELESNEHGTPYQHRRDQKTILPVKKKEHGA